MIIYPDKKDKVKTDKKRAACLILIRREWNPGIGGID